MRTPCNVSGTLSGVRRSACSATARVSFFEEKGDAVGVGDDRVGQVGGQGAAGGQGLDDGDAVAAGEAAKDQLTGIGFSEPGRLTPGAIRREQEHPTGGETLDEDDEGVGRRLVDPVEIFDRDDDGALLAPGQTELPQGLDRPGLDQLGAEGRERAFGALLEAQQVEQIGGQGLRVQPERAEPPGDLLAGELGGVSLGEREVLADDVEDR